MSTPFLRLTTLVLALGAVLVADADAGQKYRIQFLNNGRGVRSLPAEQLESGPTRAVTQLQGVAHAGRGDTVTIGRTAVRITPRTAIQSVSPKHANASLHPRVLSGRTITVFGRPDRSGKLVDASLIIVSPEAHERLLQRNTRAVGSDASRYTIPGASEDCGTLQPGAPE